MGHLVTLDMEIPIAGRAVVVDYKDWVGIGAE
jgi:hypothetical protein